MGTFVAVRAAIFNHDQPIICIRGGAQVRQNHRACRNRGEQQRIDAIGAQDQVEIGAPKRSRTMVAGDDVTVLWCKPWRTLPDSAPLVGIALSLTMRR